MCHDILCLIFQLFSERLHRLNLSDFVCHPPGFGLVDPIFPSPGFLTQTPFRPQCSDEWRRAVDEFANVGTLGIFNSAKATVTGETSHGRQKFPMLLSFGFARATQSLVFFDLDIDLDALFGVLMHFKALHALSFRRVAVHLSDYYLLRAAQIQVAQDPDFALRLPWPMFFIQLRQLMPRTAITISESFQRLPPSALQWLASNLPPDTVISDKREWRLIKDFVSFFPLWRADDSSRGTQARRGWRQNGEMAQVSTIRNLASNRLTLICSHLLTHGSVRDETREWRRTHMPPRDEPVIVVG